MPPAREFLIRAGLANRSSRFESFNSWRWLGTNKEHSHAPPYSTSLNASLTNLRPFPAVRELIRPGQVQPAACFAGASGCAAGQIAAGQAARRHPAVR